MNKKTLIVLLGAWLAAPAFAGEDSADSKALLELDRMYARIADEGDLESLWDRWDEQVVVLQEGTMRLNGRDAVKEMIKTNREVKGMSVTWTPEKAVVSESGEIGYTYGTIVFTPPEESGQAPFRESYVAVWEKQEDGKWTTVVAK